MRAGGTDEDRVLVLAPRGRDAAIIEQVLADAGLSTARVADIAALVRAIDEGVGATILTEEALSDGSVEDLFGLLERQPPWSDLPLVLLSTKRTGRRPEGASAAVGHLGNVVLLERPVNAETLAGAAASALRARRRQYQARAHLLEREEAQRRLKLANESLERRVEERTREVEAARETLTFALDSAGMGTWDLDLAHDTSRRTPQHDRIFGYDAPLQAWGQRPFLDHVLDEDRPAVVAAFASAAENGTLEAECRIRRSDDAVRWIGIKGRVEYDRHGAPARMAGIIVDRTEQHVTEDALRQAAEDGGHRPAHRGRGPTISTTC